MNKVNHFSTLTAGHPLIFFQIYPSLVCNLDKTSLAKGTKTF